MAQAQPGAQIVPLHAKPRRRIEAGHLAMLRALERKLLWLSSWMIHHANQIRPKRDGQGGPAWSVGVALGPLIRDLRMLGGERDRAGSRSHSILPAPRQDSEGTGRVGRVQMQ